MPPWLEEPNLLWGSTKLGREEYVQRLLASLVLGEAARGWNVPRPPSPRGSRFLGALHSAAFSDTPDAPPIFVDEFELPSRSPDESAGWPDHAVIWPERLFVIELKTERASHRGGQLPHYLDLAAHHHPEVDVDLLYITPTMTVAAPVALPSRSRYELMHWPAVYTLVRSIWSDSPVAWEAALTDYLASWIDDIEVGAPLPPRAAAEPEPEPASAVVDWLELAAEVQTDGRQRAGEVAIDDPEKLESLRLELRDQLRRGPEVAGVQVTHVAPWIWRAETSGGQPLTDLGASTGYELRLSRYLQEQTRRA